MNRAAVVLALLAVPACKQAPAQTPSTLAPPPALAPAPPPPPRPAAPAEERIPHFTAKLVRAGGQEVDFDSHKLLRPTVFLFVGTTCPATRDYAERFRDLEKSYTGKADFVFVYPNRTDTPEAKRAFHKETGFTSPLLDDAGARIARLLGARRTSEVHLFDREGKRLFRGASTTAAGRSG
jgi:peroxiredoxin